MEPSQRGFKCEPCREIVLVFKIASTFAPPFNPAGGPGVRLTSPVDSQT